MAKKAQKKKKTKRGGNVGLRATFAFIAFAVLCIVAVVYVAFIKVTRGNEYEKIAQAQQITVNDEVIPALRGNIYDATGVELAVSTRSYNVILDCYEMQNASEKVQKATVRILCDILSIEDSNAISKYLDAAYKEYRYLKLSQGEDISESTKEKIQAYLDDGTAAGVWFEETEKRYYPNSSLAAHVLGFNGVYGVEQYYDEYLTGTDGRRMVVYDADENYTIQSVDAQDGCDLTLTLNATVQMIMETELQKGAKKHNSQEACAIAMDPKTGAILGWACVPTFDLNDVTTVIGASDKFKEEYGGDTYYQRVWNNYGLTFTYQPGSTYKPIFSSIALEEATIGSGTTFKCTKRGYTISDTTFECFEHDVHGTETVREILVNSCNQGMVQISETLSAETYYKYQQAYGVGQLTGIDLAGEVDAAGLIYTLDTLGPVEKATCAFGQGFNVTPIQLITAFSAVINGGEYLQPYVVSSVTDSEGNVVLSNSKTVLRHTISEETSAMMRDFLGSVITDTWGWFYTIPGYTFGGKTGTAQQGDYAKEKDIVSFICFNSVEDPQVVLLVIMSADDASSSYHAAEVSKAVMTQILPVLGIYPTK